MSEMLSPILKRMEPNRVAFWCPGCEEVHSIPVSASHNNPGAAWGYNGDPERPTFTPSILVRTGHFVGGKSAADCQYCSVWTAEEKADWGHACSICHSFVREGMIEFLGDCSHALAGQTVPLPPLPEQADV